MRFLVTGALGAIGVWTLRSLLERGHAVVAFDLGGSGHRLPIALDESQRGAVTHVRGDVTDLAALERVLDEHEVERVIHLAALQVPFVRADPPLGAHVNVVGTVNVLEAARRRADRIAHVVYASSIAVYGAGAASLAGDDVPGTLYGVYKRADEGGARRYFEDFGVSSVGLRPHTVFGPARDQGLTSAPTKAVLAAAAGVPFEIPFGGGAQFQYAPDVGEAFVRAALLDGYAGASVHNLDGEPAAIADVVRLIREAVPGAQVSCAGEPLPFPAAVDATSCRELLGPVCRPLADSVHDALVRFRRLLDAGLVAAD
jgi:nucleoside-diphosphate-sugar epimerase